MVVVGIAVDGVVEVEVVAFEVPPAFVAEPRFLAFVVEALDAASAVEEKASTLMAPNASQRMIGRKRGWAIAPEPFVDFICPCLALPGTTADT